MDLTVETFWQGSWHFTAVVSLSDETRGYLGPSRVEYEIDYFANQAAAEFVDEDSIRDARALSVQYPANLAAYSRQTWPPFMLDLMPQGHARRTLAEHLRIGIDARESDLPLLMSAAGNPIGNIRIREASEAEEQRLAKVGRIGVTEADILGCSELFMDVVNRFQTIASGSSGLQGEWPKVSMTLATDGLYYPDSFVRDDEAIKHIIVKLPRSSNERDRLILEAEAGYSRLALEIGLKVHEPSAYGKGLLVIPRFDRSVEDGRLLRLGQESMVSALGVAEFGYIGSHEDYIGVLRYNSDEPYRDIVEYVKRDIANRAFGNPDNHGRNTALSKGPWGSLRLSPLFDFAPMRLAVEGIARSTRWEAMRSTHRDTSPDWLEVCQAVFPENAQTALGLLDEIGAFAEKLLSLKNLDEFGIPQAVISHAASNRVSVAEGVLSAHSRRHTIAPLGAIVCRD